MSEQNEWEPDLDAVVDGVREIGELLYRDVLEELRKEYPELTRANGGGALEVALADHFWCELLAVLSHALDQSIRLVDRLPDRFIDHICELRTNDRRVKLLTVVVRSAVRATWRRLGTLTLPVDPRTLVLVLRLLAILMCKAPERHKAVVTYCLDPLTTKVLRETRRYLADALPDWMPETAAWANRSAIPSRAVVSEAATLADPGTE